MTDTKAPLTFRAPSKPKPVPVVTEVDFRIQDMAHELYAALNALVNATMEADNPRDEAVQNAVVLLKKISGEV